MLIFVYGTLMRGQANHRVLVELGAQYLGDALTAEPRVLVDLGPYPALLSDEAVGAVDGSVREGARTPVHGELHAIDEASVDLLDAFEGCPDLYRRERIAVTTVGAAPCEAWTYVLAKKLPPRAARVPSGRYTGGGIVLRESAREADDLDKVR